MMADRYAGFERLTLEDGCSMFVGELPQELAADSGWFEEVWGLHPGAYHRLRIHGRLVETPRWQQAYGADYRYSGRTNYGLPVPEILGPLRDWACRAIDGRLNALLLNWYDGALGHYIGPHHDDPRDMISGVPIVTISLGEGRVFRLTHPRIGRRVDLSAENRAVFIMPPETNRAWKHGVPRFARDRGRRISVTLRGLGPAPGAGR